MKQKVTIVFTFFYLTLSYNSVAQNNTLKVIVKNIKNPGDTVRLLLWDNADGFPRNKELSLKKASKKAECDSVIFVFTNLKKCDYAVSCFYDENNNRKFDRSFLLQTTEPFGLSGKPDYNNLPVKFNDAKFGIDSSATIVINLHYKNDMLFLFKNR